MSRIFFNFSWFFMILCFCSQESLEATWTSPVVISSPTSSNPQIGIDTSGNAVAIWQQFDGVNTNIQTADLPKGGSWTLPTTISSVSGNNTEESQIAINALGYSVAIWVEPNGANFELKASTRQFGSSWSTPLTITISNVVSTPQVAIDAAGNTIVVWQDTPATILSSNLLFGASSWSPPLQVSPIGENSGLPRVGVDASGNAVAIWLNQGGFSFSIEAATLPFGGSSWSAAVTISNLSDNVNQPALAVNTSGFAVAAWIGFNGTDFLAQVATLPSITSGTWTPSQDVSIGSTALQPALAIDSSDNALAIWIQIGIDSIITSSYLPSGGSWSSPVGISSAGLFSFDPKAAFDDSGNAIAVWDSNNSIDIVIQAAMLPLGGSWSAPMTISTPGESSDFPEIAIDPTGYAVVNWTNETFGVIQSATWVPAPTLTAINPNSGPTSGGNTVTITGTNFINVLGVTFGSTSAASFIVTSPTTIIAIAPPGSVGTIDITVTTIAGTTPITANDQYTYQTSTPPPTVTHVIPNHGPSSGGKFVRIIGTNFIDVTNVAFGTTSALSYIVVSPILIIAISPAGVGTVDVRVTTLSGTSPITSADRYTYQN